MAKDKSASEMDCLVNKMMNIVDELPKEDKDIVNHPTVVSQVLLLPLSMFSTGITVMLCVNLVHVAGLDKKSH